MSDGIITLVGNVASDVRTIKSERGTAITSFRFAHTPRRIDRQTGRWGDGPTSFYGVTCWRSLAEHCRDCLRKGDPIVLFGRLRIRDWRTEDGRPGRDAEIDAISVGHDLVRGTSSFVRARKEQVDVVDEQELAAGLRMELLVQEQTQVGDEPPDADSEVGHGSQAPAGPNRRSADRAA
jgi:single-strand DNA-binding protein